MKDSRIVIDMDRQWRFQRAIAQTDTHSDKSHAAVYNSLKTGMLKGPATKRAFDDSTWQIVDLPHDYIRESALSPNAIANHGYRVVCNGWYRKTFTVEGRLRGKQALLVFGGIAKTSTIFLNGSVMERSHCGYNEIVVDITDRLYYDRVNTLAVFVNGEAAQGWWYEGAGIYRHVSLIFKEPVHIAHNGIWANPVLIDKEKNSWSVNLEVNLENSFYEKAGVRVQATLCDGDRILAQRESESLLCPENGQAVAKLQLPVEDPIRWDVDDPKLYDLKIAVVGDGGAVDSEELRIGFRTCYMDADKGFFLNDRPLKIKGTCNHQDHAGVGVAVPDAIQHYRVRLLKEMGSNAYRSAHNPADRAILDACDELGLMVMEENRLFEARPEVLRDLENDIRRVRNHPSVIFYSLFNEEPLQNCPEGKHIFKRLKSTVTKLDDTRIILGAVNDKYHPDGAGPEMDVLGVNYNTAALEEIRSKFPHMPMMGSESNSTFATRGCYISDKDNAHVLNCYDEEIPFYGDTARKGWEYVRKLPYFAGYFIWTGFDYRGEPSPFTWPSHSSQFGIMDTCGFPKDSWYFHKACFTQEPMMHILPHWNWNVGDTVRVMTVTNCDQAELILNGRTLGRQESDVCTQCTWQVPFEPGVLEAVGYREGVAVAWGRVETAGEPRAIRLTADRLCIHNGGQDTVPVRVSVVDDQGVEVPHASNLIHFELEGQGLIAGVGNGDPNSADADHLPLRHLFNGLCQVLVMADPGAKQLKLMAHGDGLESAVVLFEIREQEVPLWLPLKENHAITGITVSPSDCPEKPDPLKIYDQSDMNSFAPLVISNNDHTPDFYTGWREYRIPVSLVNKDGKRPAIEIGSINCARAEFYLGGQLIWEGEPAYQSALVVPLPEVAEKEFEVRALLQANPDSISTSGFGISMTVTYL